ncbi:MAG: glycosyltransferase family 9 protein [candidate division KSB1 bacterium]|nr:glycosyltransferase family 9 protein [candidate division KSB1 bacterium]
MSVKRIEKYKTIKQPKRFLISRSDGIGDVVLTLPLAGALKRRFPDCWIAFLGKRYTEALIRACRSVDEFWDWEALQTLSREQQAALLAEGRFDAVIHVFPRKEIAAAAKQAGIPLRIGTSHRWFHWLTCNKLVHFSRRNSDQHEAQLNFRLLQPFGISADLSLPQIADLYDLEVEAPPEYRRMMDGRRLNLILHPASRGSAKEWGIENWAQLIAALPQDQFRLFLTGSEEEGRSVRPSLVAPFSHVTDMTGKLDLAGLMGFIAAADALLACSTGPLHLAAALGKCAVGLYASRRPIHPGRWAPIGKHVIVLEDGLKDRYSGPVSISVQKVIETLLSLGEKKSRSGV